jgi:hypothetical protein
MTTQLRGVDRKPVARDLAARYRSGQSIRVIANEIGRSYCYVWHLLADAGVQFRGRGGAQPRKATGGWKW